MKGFSGSNCASQVRVVVLRACHSIGRTLMPAERRARRANPPLVFLLACGLSGMWSARVSAQITSVPDTATTQEDRAVEVDVLENDTQVLGNIPNFPLFNIARVTQPADGSVVIDRANGQFRRDTVRYTPRANFSGTDTFTYTALDLGEQEEGSPTTVTITVTPVNDPPDAADDSATTRQGSAVTIAVLSNDKDPEGDPLTIDSVEKPRHGTAAIAGNSVTYTPDPSFSGTDQFEYRATDGTDRSERATVTITVTPNAAPTSRISGGNRTIPDSDRVAGETVHLDGSTSSDSDGTIASYQWFNGQTSIGSGPVIDARLPDGDNTIKLVVTDNEGATGSSTVTVSVVMPPPNFAPTATITGGNRTIPDSDRVAGETVHLDGSSSSDSDGTIASYQWFDAQQTPLGSGPTLDVRLPDGDNVIQLVVTDDDGATGSATATISVASPPPRGTLQDLPDLTPNEHSVAVALDDLCPRLTQQTTLTEEQTNLLTRCNGLSFDSDPARQTQALSEITGQDLNAMKTQTLLLGRDMSVGVIDRMMALRSGAEGLSAAPGLNLLVNGQPVPPEMLQLAADEVMGQTQQDVEAEPFFSDRWGFWMRGNFGSSDKESSIADPGFDADQWGITGGADYRVPEEQAVFGVSLGYGKSDASFNPSGEGGVDTSAWNISVYGGLYPEDGLFYADGFLSYGGSSYDTERRVHYDDSLGTVDVTAKGSTDGTILSAGVSAGHDFLVGQITISPNARLYYLDATVDGFTESGASGLDLAYDKQSFESATASLGVRITGAFNLGWAILLPHVRADAVWEFQDGANTIGAHFANDPFVGTPSPTPNIVVTSEDADDSFLVLAVGLSAQLRYGISAYVEYQTMQGLEFLDVSNLALGMRVQYNFH
jgi:outer membrane autotransporter protein